MRAPRLLALLALCVPGASHAHFQIDQTRSYADFGVRLLWLHTISGRFHQIDGDLVVDQQGKATVDVRIALDRVAMESARFRRWVLAPEFFDAEAFPSARFLSDPVPFSRLAGGGELSGRLSLRGVVRPIRLTLLPSTCSRTDCTIQAEGQLLRRDFGMTSRGATLSNRVKLDLHIVLQPR